MTISRYAAVVDALVALATTDATLVAAGVQPFDGPPLSQPTGTTLLAIGWTGDYEDETAGTIQQGYHDLGPAATRDEIVTVNCVIQTWRGDDDMSQAREDSVAALGALETALRADVDAGVADALALEMSDATVRQARDAEGLYCQIDFTITATSLI